MAFDGIQIGAVWLNTNANGQQFLSGRLGNQANLLILPNKEATPENRLPTHNVFLTPPKTKSQPTNGGHSNEQ